MKLKFSLPRYHISGLLREYNDNYYDKIRVYRSRFVTDIQSASDYALQLRNEPGFHIGRIFCEDLELREEEHALPVEEDGGISDELLLTYIRSSDIDIIKFVGKYKGKSIEIGIRKDEWEVWLRIRHLTGEELNLIEDKLGLK